MNIGLVDDTPGRTKADGTHNNLIYCHQPEHLKHQRPRRNVNNESEIEYKETHTCVGPTVKNHCFAETCNVIRFQEYNPVTVAK